MDPALDAEFVARYFRPNDGWATAFAKWYAIRYEEYARGPAHRHGLEYSFQVYFQHTRPFE